MQPTYFWHDYETFGSDPRRDAPAQFAGLRTNAELEPIEEPLRIFCKPSVDVLPHPEACLITGITPQQAFREGIPEPEFFAQIHEQLARPGTCTVGYNSIRFDDEVTRHGLWRNFHDPYGREWRNGCSRWDLIDALRMAYALRPEGIVWPLREDGTLPSFKLEHLSKANGVAHVDAHDALNDVTATLALAQRFRRAQPKLFEYLFGLREKRKAAALLDWNAGTAVLHSSSRFRAERGCTALVMPITQHPTQPNGVIVVDLDADPTDLINLDASEIRDRVFVANADLPEDVQRIPLKTVHVNKSPALAPLSVLQGVDAQRIGLDVERCLAHREQLMATDLLAQKVREVFATDSPYPKAEAEAELYSGLPGNADLALAARFRLASPKQMRELQEQFADARYRELAFRYRARNYPDNLDNEEQLRWLQWRRDHLLHGASQPERQAEALLALTATLRQSRKSEGEAQRVLDQVEYWIRNLIEELQ